MNPLADPVKVAYDDWVELLKHTKNEHMLQDSYTVWLEAFHVAGIFERARIQNALQRQMAYIGVEGMDDAATLTVAEAKQLQLSLLKQACSLANES